MACLLARSINVILFKACAFAPIVSNHEAAPVFDCEILNPLEDRPRELRPSKQVHHDRPLDYQNGSRIEVIKTTTQLFPRHVQLSVETQYRTSWSLDYVAAR